MSVLACGSLERFERAEPEADPHQGGGDGSASLRANHLRARAQVHVRAADHRSGLHLRLREVARLEADHARGGDPADGRGAELTNCISV